jgi:hypothetical protein
MKRIYLYVYIVLVFSCASKFEVRENEAAVTFDKETGEVSPGVLKEGSYTAEKNTGVILYGTAQKKMDLSFDFLFKDASPGSISLKIKYTPKIDSLPKFYKQYGDVNMEALISIEIRRTIRNSMANLLKENIALTGVDSMIRHDLDSATQWRNSFEIDEFQLTKFKY